MCEHTIQECDRSDEEKMDKKKDIIFIVNPISGTSGKRRILELIEKKLDRAKFNHTVVTTQYGGHAAEIARAAANKGVDAVCAIGGDGTINEVARALAHSATALAIIPAGSGNGLARHLHIPMDANKAIDVLNEYNLMDMDYGLINNHPFFCTCGMGFDAFISMKFAQAGKRGPLTYIDNVLKNGLKYNPDTYEIYVDDKPVSEYKAFLISCANASQYGNNAYIAPEASVCDGLLDVTIIEPFTVLDAPSISIQLFNGKIQKNSRIRSFRCKKMHIRRERKGAIHFDGDPIIEGTEIDVEIVPAGLKCVSCKSEEGMTDIRENIQSFFTEQFSDIVHRSENLLQENIRKGQNFSKLNVEILKKITRI